MVYAEFGGHTECIMGNSKIVNAVSFGIQKIILQLTPNRCTTTIEETEHFPVAEKKILIGIEWLGAWRSQNWKKMDALVLIKY